MTEEEVRKANEIMREIKELESFIHTAEKAWTGKIIKQDTKYMFKSKEYEMDTETKNDVLHVLRTKL